MVRSPVLGDDDVVFLTARGQCFTDGDGRRRGYWTTPSGPKVVYVDSSNLAGGWHFPAAQEAGRPDIGYEVRRVVAITFAAKSSSTIETGAQRARSAVLLVMILRITATAE
jgi:hypothetical protein